MRWNFSQVNLKSTYFYNRIIKKIYIIIILLSSFCVFADIIVHGEQKAGMGGSSVFGEGCKDGDIFVVYNNKKISLTQCAKKHNFKLKNYKITKGTYWLII